MRASFFVLLLLSFFPSLKPQASVSIESDSRLFTFYAFFVGVLDYYDQSDPSFTNQQKTLRHDIQEKLKSIPSETQRQWVAYYETHPGHIYNYLEAILSQESSPLVDFRSILLEFSSKCHIDDLYASKYRDVVRNEVEKYSSSKIERNLDLIYRYLKMDKPLVQEQTIYILPIPFEQKYCAYCIYHDTSIHILDGPGSTDYGLNIHEYLHTLLHPIIQKKLDGKEELFTEVLKDNKEKSIVKNSYSHLPTFVEECFVRALDNRLEEKSGLSEEEALDGLALVPYFFNRLEEYENNSTLSFAQFVQIVLSDYHYSQGCTP